MGLRHQAPKEEGLQIDAKIAEAGGWLWSSRKIKYPEPGDCWAATARERAVTEMMWTGLEGGRSQRVLIPHPGFQPSLCHLPTAGSLRAQERYGWQSPRCPTRDGLALSGNSLRPSTEVFRLPALLEVLQSSL